MKITLVAQTPTGWHQRDLARAALERGVDLEVVDIKHVNELQGKLKDFGDVIIWRATSGVDSLSERTSASLYFDGRPVLNMALFEKPFTAYKYYQQSLFAKKVKRFSGITTYRVLDKDHLKELIDQGKLKYPFIAKPNLGSKGKGIIVVEKEADLKHITDCRNLVYQNFIKNTGDWRVIVVGGRSLGAMRRIAKKGSYLNNISQGATAVNETRPEVRDVVMEMAASVASAFGLAYCGVDIIQDEATGEFHFMEVNTAPQWNGEYGFASITGVDVAAEIIDLAIDLADRKTTPTAELVKRFYDKHIGDFKSKSVHYASRMYLWTGDKLYRDMLDAVEADYLGAESKATEKRLKKLLSGEALNKARIGVQARVSYFEKYPTLQPINRLLFKVLFARTLYGRDVSGMVEKLVGDDQMIDLFNKLKNDHDAIRVLSTFALNFIYLLKNYFLGKNLKLANLVLINPSLIEELLHDYDRIEQSGEISRDERFRLQIYLVTHAIIGESQFYNRMVNDEGYRRLLRFVESLIENNYFDISLDCKMEFLVCCRLTRYNTALDSVILSEAERSLSPIGNFLVDRHNTSSDAVLKNRISKAEHRNVLYLMASTPFRKDKKSTIAGQVAKKETQKTIGRMAQVDFPEHGVFGAKARVDSGAFFSSVHATDIVENLDNTLSFTLLGDYHDSIKGVRVTVDKFINRPIKNTSGKYENRYLVYLRTKVLDAEEEHIFTLADRKNMACPVLLGRTFLKTGYVVDVSRQFN